MDALFVTGKVRSLKLQCEVFLLRNYTAQQIANVPLPKTMKSLLLEFAV